MARIETLDILPTALDVILTSGFSQVEGRSFVDAIYGSRLERTVQRSARLTGDEMNISIRDIERRYDDFESRKLEFPDHKAAVDAMIKRHQDRQAQRTKKISTIPEQ